MLNTNICAYPVNHFSFYISIWIFIEKKYHEIVVRRNFFSGFFWLLACFTTHSLSLQKFTGKQYDYNKPQFQIITNESLKHFVKLNYNLYDIYFYMLYADWNTEESKSDSILKLFANYKNVTRGISRKIVEMKLDWQLFPKFKTKSQ